MTMMISVDLARLAGLPPAGVICEIIKEDGDMARVPDLVVYSEELAKVLEGATRSLILMDMPPPLLVVEVVSPSTKITDYRAKRTEYAARDIPEYWIVDPMGQKVTVLEWVEGFYDERVYEGESTIVSAIFNNCSLFGKL